MNYKLGDIIQIPTKEEFCKLLKIESLPDARSFFDETLGGKFSSTYVYQMNDHLGLVGIIDYVGDKYISIEVSNSSYRFAWDKWIFEPVYRHKLRKKHVL